MKIKVPTHGLCYEIEECFVIGECDDIFCIACVSLSKTAEETHTAQKPQTT